MVYVELWFDEEKEQDKGWKITLWQLRDKDYDFDPFTAHCITLDLNIQNQHKARKVQLDIVRDLKKTTNVVSNGYGERSRYEIIPRWMEELKSPLGKSNNSNNTTERNIHLTEIRQVYITWCKNIG